MSQENPLWGSERLRGELLKLGIAVSNRFIRRYRWRAPGRPPSPTWRTFLRNHAHPPKRPGWSTAAVANDHQAHRASGTSRRAAAHSRRRRASSVVTTSTSNSRRPKWRAISGGLLRAEIEVQGVAVGEEVEEPLELGGRGGRVPGAPDAPQTGPGH